MTEHWIVRNYMSVDKALRNKFVVTNREAPLPNGNHMYITTIGTLVRAPVDKRKDTIAFDTREAAEHALITAKLRGDI